MDETEKIETAARFKSRRGRPGMREGGPWGCAPARAPSGGAAVRRLVRAIGLAILLVAAGQATAVAADFLAGKTAFDRGDYAAALQEWLPLAEAGHGTAQQNVGFMYYHGFGVARDPATALRWFRRAAENGQGESQMMLGVMYGNGEGVERDLTESLTWFTVAILTLKDPENRRRAMENRTAVAQQMSQEDIETAIDRAYAWSGTTLRDGRVALDSLAPTEPAPAPRAVAPVQSGAAYDSGAAATAAETSPASPAPAAESGPAGEVTGFYVQTASLENRDAVDVEWRRQRARHADLLASRDRAVEEATLADGRVVYRLQIGPFARQGAARDLCAALKKQSQDCIVVRR